MLQDDHRESLRRHAAAGPTPPRTRNPSPHRSQTSSSCTPTTSHSTRRSAAENDAPPPEPSPSSSAPSPARRLSTTRCAHLPSHNSTPTSGPLAPRSNTSTLRPSSSASNGSASGSPHRQSSPISVSRSELLDSYLRYLTSQPSGPGQPWLSLTRITSAASLVPRGRESCGRWFVTHERCSRPCPSSAFPGPSPEHRAVRGSCEAWWTLAAHDLRGKVPGQGPDGRAPSAGLEPAHTAPEADALSAELRGRGLQNTW